MTSPHETEREPSGPAATEPVPRPQPRRRRLLWAVVALAAAGGIVFAVLHWQERTLREAQRELQQGNSRRALALVNYFLESHPNHGPALALKARVLSVGGRPQEAVELYEEVGAATTEDLHAWARAYLVLQSWSRAVPLLTQVLRREPDNADALHEITGCRTRLGLLQEALETARQLAQLPGQEARGWVLQAAIHNDLVNPQAAGQAYQRVVELAPDGKGLQVPPEELFMQYGIVLLTLGQGDGAVPWLERSLASRPTAAAYFYLGNAHAQAGRNEPAEQAWQKSLQLDPAGVPPVEALADCALQRRDTDAALRWLKPLGPVAEVRHKTAYLLQRTYLLRKDPEQAERWRKKAEELRKADQRHELLEQLLLRSPYSFWANVARAHRFAAQGNWRQAEDMLQELAREAPRDAFVQELADAVHRRGPLPSIDRISIQQR
jgi:tetratricopeptide (TPR) repeat protein